MSKVMRFAIAVYKKVHDKIINKLLVPKEKPVMNSNDNVIKLTISIYSQVNWLSLKGSRCFILPM